MTVINSLFPQRFVKIKPLNYEKSEVLYAISFHIIKYFSSIGWEMPSALGWLPSFAVGSISQKQIQDFTFVIGV